MGASARVEASMEWLNSFSDAIWMGVSFLFLAAVASLLWVVIEGWMSVRRDDEEPHA